MKLQKILSSTSLMLLVAGAIAAPSSMAKHITVEKQYMNVPTIRTKHGAEMRELRLLVDGEEQGVFVMPFNSGDADYYTALDMRPWMDKKIELTMNGDQDDLNRIVFSDEIIADQPVYTEANRPQYHFSAKRGWINDPNGLIYADGLYHLYYQHNPFNVYWENMSWGHATSTDLLHWTEQPVVLFSKDRSREAMCYSGASFVDTRNQLGHQEGDKESIIAFYLRTGLGLSYAYSNDGGMSFKDDAGNPVIKNKEHRIDTPRAFWHEASQKWVMTCFDTFKDDAGDTWRCVGIYSSADLREWSYESRVEHVGNTNIAGDELCGCVDFFELKVEGQPELRKWVMIFVNGSYAVGDFDGKNFTKEGGELITTEDRITTLVVPQHYYATMTWDNDPKGRRVQTAWLSTIDTEIEEKFTTFSQQFTLPSELKLHASKDGYYLTMTPIEEVEKLRVQSTQKEGLSVVEANELLAQLHGDLYELELQFKPQQDEVVELELRGQKIVYDANNGRLTVGPVVAAHLHPQGDLVSLRIFVDRNSIEVFANNGSSYLPYVCNGLHHFPHEYSIKSSKGGQLLRFDIHQLRSVWE